MTNRHKHADMIIAKAENMDLVVFCRDSERDKRLPKDLTEWGEVEGYYDFPEFLNIYDYFLCLPQHKEACLHWLNGGEIQMQSDNEWLDVEMYKSTMRWHSLRIFMEDCTAIRIKPRKEKLYIAVKTENYEHLGGCRKVRICSHAFVSKEDAESYLDLSDSQLVEIEVDV